MGPAGLRTAGFCEALGELGHDVADLGDLPRPAPVAVDMPDEVASRCRNLSEIAGWTQAIHDRAGALVESGVTPIFVGGDHSIAMGTVSGVARAVAAAGRELVVLWLDAHADYNTPATSPSGNMHGMPVAFLTGDTSLRPVLGARDFVPVAPDKVHLFGLRSVDGQERRRLASDGIGSVDMRLIDEFGVAVLMRRFLDSLAGRDVHLHVSFDVDFLDPGIAPGVGTAVPGGASYREAHLIMEMLHDSGLVGSLDVVELNPYLDDRGASARLVTDLVGSLFGRSVLERPRG